MSSEMMFRSEGDEALVDGVSGALSGKIESTD
jgi:hypothetical protein